MNKIIGEKLYRVDKRVAKRAYNTGKPVYLLPCKTCLDSMWVQPCRAIVDEYTTIGTSTGFDTVIARNKQFETVVTCFTYYNCNNELGRYPAFYMERG